MDILSCRLIISCSRDITNTLCEIGILINQAIAIIKPSSYNEAFSFFELMESIESIKCFGNSTANVRCLHYISKACFFFNCYRANLVILLLVVLVIWVANIAVTNIAVLIDVIDFQAIWSKKYFIIMINKYKVLHNS